MQKYQKFMVETVALVGELARTAKKAKDDMAIVDARLLRELVDKAKDARGGFIRHHAFVATQAAEKLRTRFNLGR